MEIKDSILALSQFRTLLKQLDDPEPTILEHQKAPLKRAIGLAMSLIQKEAAEQTQIKTPQLKNMW